MSGLNAECYRWEAVLHSIGRSECRWFYAKHWQRDGKRGVRREMKPVGLRDLTRKAVRKHGETKRVWPQTSRRSLGSLLVESAAGSDDLRRLSAPPDSRRLTLRLLTQNRRGQSERPISMTQRPHQVLRSQSHHDSALVLDQKIMCALIGPTHDRRWGHFEKTLRQQGSSVSPGVGWATLHAVY